MKTPSLILIPLLLGGCADICRQVNGTAVGSPLVQVQESVEYEARSAGIPAGELRSTIEEMLRSQGVALAGVDAKPTVVVSVDVRLIDPGFGGYAGLIRLAVHEPATLWSTGQGVQAITSTQDLVFTTPKRELREYVRENLRDAVAEMLKAHPRLAQR